ncbi:hypothetical protein ClosIBUN13A_CONTIG102g01341 [Clostridium sp. IBUN13A]|uniref:Uncharacterized protein n=1 Tax=Clostridium butyricum E4 str. BoNT E BL5262 TaxID=632245 RepID=C4IHU4_CLOBU|nr:hypothetical protein CBY_0253 [Clostridium butyricum 5521]EEP54401.1 hypothetical protein CLP_2826 [Clostridium butyricum E4 str. BoNT E BL5262]KJZ97900.1 hypothetical protein ClosIBUN13A_CONTIG102g01341 [Clostridium sp. IBUN13A]
MNFFVSREEKKQSNKSNVNIIKCLKCLFLIFINIYKSFIFVKIIINYENTLLG